MIACPKCGKENQPHYKFCLGCGGELPRQSESSTGPAKPGVSATPPSGSASAQGGAPAAGRAGGGAGAGRPRAGESRTAPPASVGKHDEEPTAVGAGPGAPAHAAAAPGAAPAAGAKQAGGQTTPCPQCGKPVPAMFAFCGSCGAKMGGSAARMPAPAASAAAAMSRARLVLIRPDGTEGGSYPLADGQTSIGREAGGIFGADSYLSPKHASFVLKGNTMAVRDEGSLNGIYVRIPREQPTELKNTDVFRIGQEIIRYEELGGGNSETDGTESMGSPADGLWGRICLIVGRDAVGNAFPIGGEGIVLGRERGDILFPEDGYVSGLHCRILREGQKTFLVDMGSSNGTFLRVRSERAITAGDFLLMGQQLFKIVF